GGHRYPERQRRGVLSAEDHADLLAHVFDRTSGGARLPALAHAVAPPSAASQATRARRIIARSPIRWRSHVSSPATGARFWGVRGSAARPAKVGRIAETRSASRSAASRPNATRTSQRTRPVWSCHGRLSSTRREYQEKPRTVACWSCSA